MSHRIKRPTGIYTPGIIHAFNAIRKYGRGFIPDSVNARDYAHALASLDSQSADSLGSIPHIGGSSIAIVDIPEIRGDDSPYVPSVHTTAIDNITRAVSDLLAESARGIPR